MKVCHFKIADYVLHSYAYDQYGNYILIDDAIHLSDRQWYLDKNLQVELIAVNFKEQKKQVYHWKVKSNQYLEIQGKKYKYDSAKDSESYHHKQMKGSIISNGFFYMDNYKIYIQNASEEFRICDSKFKADISCTMLCGTPCIIEVIKTSDISEAKKNYLKENEILTFKIYIDENGNQIFQKSTYFGGEKIDRIKESIHKGQGAVVSITREYESANEEAKKRMFDEVFRFSNEMDRRKQRYFPILISTENIEGAITEQDSFIRDLSTELDGIKKQIEQLEKYSAEISQLEIRDRELKGKIEEIIEDCKTEWFTNRSINLKREYKHKEILYWIS